MTKWTALALGLLQMGVIGACTEATEAGKACGDLLADSGSSTDGLKLLSCGPGKTGQLDALVATYRVAAADVDTVEARLVKRTEVRKLRFVCCGWESPPHVFRGDDGEHYQLELASAEETDDRARERMPDLRVTVSRLLVLP